MYVAYTRLDYSNMGCTGTPDSSQIFMLYSDNDGVSWGTGARRVSPLATSGAAHYRSPSLAVLPDGRVIVAFRDDSSGADRDRDLHHAHTAERQLLRRPARGFVGPSTVVGDATSPAVVSGVAGAPAPSVVAAGGRVTVAWHANAPNGVRAFAAMSRDGGATFGPAQQIDPDGAGNQIAPRLAATADGRVDVAYLWDTSGTGVVSATTASAAPPLPGATDRGLGQSRDRAGGRSPGGDRHPGHRAARQEAGRRDLLGADDDAAQPAAGDRRRLHGHLGGGGNPGRARRRACCTARRRR